MDRGPFLDPFFLQSPCCCFSCCSSSIAQGVRTVATISMVVATGYGVMGIWFAFNALLPGDSALIQREKSTTKSGSVEVTNDPDNLIEILLICSIASLIAGVIRFLSSLFLLRSIKKESKTPAKVWVAITYGLVIVVTAVVLAASQKNDNLFKSLTIKIFLSMAFVDFVLLLYFLWVIIVYVKEAIDMPGL